MYAFKMILKTNVYMKSVAVNGAYENQRVVENVFGLVRAFCKTLLSFFLQS